MGSVVGVRGRREQKPGHGGYRRVRGFCEVELMLQTQEVSFPTPTSTLSAVLSAPASAIPFAGGRPLQLVESARMLNTLPRRLADFIEHCNTPLPSTRPFDR